MKTKEEILETTHSFMDDTLGRCYERVEVESSMDEYASQFQQEWIPVEVKLPDDGSDYLVTDGNAVMVATYKTEISQWYFWKNNFWESKEVTHWMPLPPKPQPYNPTKS